MPFDELVHVYSVKEPIEAEIIKNALHAAGIHAAIENENQAGLTGIFDIRLFVPAHEEAAARQILAEHEEAMKRAPSDDTEENPPAVD